MATPPTPIIRLGHAALQYRPLRLNTLASNNKTKLIQTSKSGSSHFGVWEVVLAWGRGLPDD